MLEPRKGRQAELMTSKGFAEVSLEDGIGVYLKWKTEIHRNIHKSLIYHMYACLKHIFKEQMHTCADIWPPSKCWCYFTFYPIKSVFKSRQAHAKNKSKVDYKFNTKVFKVNDHVSLIVTDLAKLSSDHD